MSDRISHVLFTEYCCICQEVASAPSTPIWHERHAYAKGFSDALNRVGHDVYAMGLRAQRMWVEQDRASGGLPLSYDNPPTLREDDWKKDPVKCPWDGLMDENGDLAEELVDPEPVLTGTIIVGQHPYQDDWDWFEGIPGKCGAPFCGYPGEHNIHTKPEPHEWEEHPQAPGLCRECGCPEGREWHTD